MSTLIGFLNILTRAVGAAITAYEIYEFGSNIYDKTKQYGSIIEDAKKKLKPAIEQMQKDLNKSTVPLAERALLDKYSKMDSGGYTTQKEKTRFEKEYKVYIKEKIPFRALISEICEIADKNAIPELRKRPKITVKDLGRSKAKILENWAGLLIAEMIEMDIADEFLVARLKQFAASIMFEYVDDIFYWKSPIKPEVCFGGKFEDPKYDSQIPLKLQRSDTDINPFYPSPYRDQKGSFAADLVIPETRMSEISKTNIYAIVEIKFPRDKPGKGQMDKYKDYLIKSKKEKERKYGQHNNLSKHNMVHGGKLALFRYPEDTPNYGKTNSTQKNQGASR